MLRWLLPIVAVIALVGSSVTAWAAAGVFGDTSCCCPVKARCTCHDHDGRPDPTPTLKKCGDGATRVAPVLVHAIPPPEITVTVARRATPAATSDRPPILESRSIEPETPPF